MRGDAPRGNGPTGGTPGGGGSRPGTPGAPGVPQAPALRLEGVSLPFGPPVPEGLREVSLEVGAGERLVLVGASGVGKSSLLRAVAGLHPLTGGRIEIGGREVDAPGAPAVPPEARGAVYLHQVPLLFPHLSVLENVAFPLRVRGVARGEREARARELLAAVHLEPLATRTPEALSGGERHRVALARAVAARPPLLLLDEPLSSLDPGLRHEVRQAIVALQEASGAGLLLVTHDLDEAGALGHRIGILVPGRLAQLAPPSQLFAHPASLPVSRFLGYRNEVPVRWAPDPGGWHHPALGILTREAPATTRRREAAGGPERRGAAGGPEPRGAAATPDRRAPAGSPAPGESAVAVLPPGTVRVVRPLPSVPDPASRLQGGAPENPAHRAEPLRDGRHGRGRARVVGLHHPGPRPLARVEVLTTGPDEPGSGPDRAPPEAGKAAPALQLEADLEPGFLPEVGGVVELHWDGSRVCVFPVRPLPDGER